VVGTANAGHAATVRGGDAMSDKAPKVVVIKLKKPSGNFESVRARLETDDLTYELGVETAEAGVSFDYWPYRCIRATEFKRGFMSAATVVEIPGLTVDVENGRFINTKIN
jgi:hypothetical protein